MKEGIGPCTFCAHPLLSPSEITSMIQALREERGQEKMAFNNAAHRRADVSQTPRAFATPSRNDSPGPVVSSSSAVDATLDLARQHRDKLLAFQNENARRTHVIDEAADFETPTSGQSIWSSPVERAAQLKMQQKVLREQEWNAKPEYEKKRIVVSVDLVGGKVVRKMADRERPVEKDEMESNLGVSAATMEVIKGGNGAFSNNPLLGSLIRPVWKGKDTERDGEDKEKLGKTTWRRVQDEDEDNEAWILDGGVYGGREGTEILAANLNV